MDYPLSQVSLSTPSPFSGVSETLCTYRSLAFVGAVVDRVSDWNDYLQSTGSIVSLFSVAPSATSRPEAITDIEGTINR